MRVANLATVRWFYETGIKVGHSGSNLDSNITHLKTIFLIWHVVNEERNVWSNLASYCNTHLSRQNESIA